MISSSANGTTWTAPDVVDDTGALGHQLMPALTFGAGKLSLVFYDFREDKSQLFQQYVDETSILNGTSGQPYRHTTDVWLAQADSAAHPAFTSVQLSEYAFGVSSGSPQSEQLTFNPPNLPLFRQGQVPFIGDYIDVTASPSIKLDPSGVWTFNTNSTDSGTGYAVWTDNRNVRAGPGGSMTEYTPPDSTSRGTQSIYDPTQSLPQCVPSLTGTRNQDIFGARFDQGLFATALGNNKPLSLTVQRGFALLIANSTTVTRSYKLTINNQPLVGAVSFRQFGAPLETLDVAIPRFSTVARTVYATSSNPNEKIVVDVSEITAPGGVPVGGGLHSNILINADPSNPAIENPAIENPAIENPSILSAEAYNPVMNPAIENPAIENPAIENPAIENPAIENITEANKSIVNPAIENPAIENPAIENPAIENPAIENLSLTNASITDTTWELTNNGNTTAVYGVKLLLNKLVPNGIFTQLIVHKNYTTPSTGSTDCELKVQLHSNVLVNITSPQFSAQNPAAPAIENPAIENPAIENPAIENATVALAPGETAFVTVRVVDPDITDLVTFEPAAAVTPAAVAQSVNTEEIAALPPGAPPPPPPATVSTTIAVPELEDAIFLTGNYGQQLYASVPGTWSIVAGALPTGVNLAPTGLFSGAPTTPGTFQFTVQFTTSGVPAQSVQRSFTVSIAEPLAIVTAVLPDGVTGFAYSASVVAAGGVDPKTWSITSGILPAGLQLDAATGTIFGTPTQTGTFPITVQVQDAALTPSVTSASFTLVIADLADFERTWVGANTDWNDPANWSPNGVPGPGDDVILIGASAHPVLSSDISIQSLVLLDGASIDTGGFTITVSGSVQAGHTITGSGSLLMIGSNVTLSGDVSGLHIAPGATVELLGPNTVHVSGDLVLEGGLDLGGLSLIVDGTLVVPSGLAVTPSIVGAGATITVGGLDVDGLVLDNAHLVMTDGQFVQFDNVQFLNFPPQVTQLAISDPGEPLPWTFNNVSFFNEPTSGEYFLATDSLADPNVFTVHLVNAVAANGPSHTAPVNGAVVNWATQLADLEITKQDSADPIPVNGALTYTLGVTNHGPDTAVDVQVVDTLPAAVSFVSASAGCNEASGIVTCSLGDLVSGASAGATIAVQPTASGILQNTASTFSSTADQSLANNVATELTTVTPAASTADLSLTKTHTGTPVVGTQFSYVLTVTNDGP